MPKQMASWGEIVPGDIVSFRYEPLDETKKPRMQTVLVLNPKFPKKLKNGKKQFYINVLKLEESNRKVFMNTTQAWQLLKEMGWISIQSLKNEIYTIEIDHKFLVTYVAQENLYNVLK